MELWAEALEVGSPRAANSLPCVTQFRSKLTSLCTYVLHPWFSVQKKQGGVKVIPPLVAQVERAWEPCREALDRLEVGLQLY